MGMVAIARLMNGKDVMGLRLLSYTDAGMKKRVETDIKDVPMSSIKAVILSGRAEIDNLGIVDDKVVGTNGTIDRLAELVNMGGTFVLADGAKSPLVVLSKIDNVGYTVVDYNGQVKRLPNDVVLDYAETNGIANGKVVTKEGSSYISSISGEYEEVKIAKSKYGGKAIDMSHLGLSTKRDNNTIAKETGMAVSNSIEYKDAFNAISDRQESVMKEWYMWYTVRAYEEISHSLRLDIAPTKIANLARFKSDLEWKLAGMWDAKIFGSSHCELGHPLRYEYHAKGYDENGEECGHLIFGETCSSDFFEISKEDMDRLIKIRMQMTYEIDTATEAFTNGTVDMEWSKCGALKIIIERMVEEKRSREDYVDLFGFEPAVFLSKYMTAGIPFPESLVHMAKKNMMQCSRARALSCIFGNKAKWDERKDFLDITYEKEAASYYGRRENFNIVAKFIDWVMGMSIGGVYGYYPVMYETVNGRSQNMKVGKNDEEGKKLAIKLAMGSGQFSKDDREEYWYGVKRFLSAFNLYSDVFYSSTIIGAGDQSERLVRFLEYVASLAAVWIDFAPLRSDLENTLREYKAIVKDIDEYRSETGVYISTGRYNISDAVDEYLADYKYSRDVGEITIPKTIAAFVVTGTEDNPFTASNTRAYTSRVEKSYKVYDDYIDAIKSICGEQEGGIELTKEVFEAVTKIKERIVAKTTDLRNKLDDSKITRIRLEEERKEAERKRQEERERRLAEEAKARELEEEKKKEDEEEAKKREEEAKSASEVNKMDELSKLLDKWKDLENGYKTAISRDIIGRGLDYNDLSYKQKKIIDETYNMYKHADSNNGELPSDDIVEITDEEAKSYQAVYDAIMATKKLKEKVEDSSKIALDVFKTVIRTKKMSPKQKKHVDNILEIIRQ